MKDPIPSWRLNRPWKKTLTGKTIKNIDISEGYIELCDGNGIYLGEIGGLFYLNEKFNRSFRFA